MRYLIFSLLALMAFLSGGCKGDNASAGGALADGDLDLKQIEAALARHAAQDSSVLDFELLKAALPEKLFGMDRSEHQGQESAFLGLSLSTAEATYSDDERKITVSLMDTGGMGEVLSGLTEWTELNVNKESDDGYERSVMIDGQKAFERYSKANQSGELVVLAGDRLIISLNGNGVGPDDLQKGLRKIKLRIE